LVVSASKEEYDSWDLVKRMHSIMS